jgi:hypothetical protein
MAERLGAYILRPFEPGGAGTIRYYAHIVDCAHKQ